MRPYQQWLVIVLAILVAVLPLLLVSHLPLVDYPNHLAQFEIYRLLPTSAPLRAFWRWEWAVIPNLAVEVIIIPFTWVMRTEPAANLVMLCSLIVTCGSTILLLMHLFRFGLYVVCMGGFELGRLIARPVGSILPGWPLTIRGGGDPSQNMVIEPFVLAMLGLPQFLASARPHMLISYAADIS